MITVAPITNQEELLDFYNRKGLECKKNSGCAVAMFGSECLGYCTYELEKDKITVTSLSPTNDIMMADGILRSALHIADARGITKAYYFVEQNTEKVLEKLKFIADKQDKTLRIEKLHESCCGCNEK